MIPQADFRQKRITPSVTKILKKLLYILSIMVLGITHSQDYKDSVCSLQAENAEWKLKFSKSASKSEQIEFIRQKLIADSIYVETKPVINTVHGRINSHEDRNGNYCGCKISFILVPKGKGVRYNLNLNSRPNLIEVINSFNEMSVENIFYMLENNNSALGPSGKCGVVKLTTKDKDLINLIKNVW